MVLLNLILNRSKLKRLCVHTHGNTTNCFSLCLSSQAAWYIFPRNDNKFVYSTIFTALTYGLGHFCILETIDRLQVSALLLIQPFVLLVVFIAIRVARSYPRTALFLARRSSHMTLVRVMWFVLIYSYFMLVFSSISMLWCVDLGSRRVLAIDGSIQCFGDHHLPYAILAIVILVSIIIPAPLLLIVPQARGYTQFKGFIDEASRLYRHKRCWWAGVNLLRRVLMAVFGVSWFGNEYHRLLALTCFLLLLYMSHDVIRLDMDVPGDPL